MPPQLTNAEGAVISPLGKVDGVISHINVGIERDVKVQNDASQSRVYAKDEAWRSTIDMTEWTKDVRILVEQMRAQQGEDDLVHLEKVLLASRSLYWLGIILSAFYPPWVNPIPAMMLAIGICIRWACVMHHVSHGGYTTTTKTAGSDASGSTKMKQNPYKRGVYATGSTWRRAMDWLDWLLPEAWNLEHNHLHHYRLNETTDPDLVERNLEWIRSQEIPVVFKYLEMAVMMLSWKFFYYLPNTVKEYDLYQATQKERALKRNGGSTGEALNSPNANPNHHNGVAYEVDDTEAAITLFYIVDEMIRKGNSKPFRRTFAVAFPYILWHYITIPLFFYAVSGFSSYCLMVVLANMFTADILSNLHSFIIIVPNHAGSDMYKFDTKCTPRSGDFYLRAVIGSANYPTGGFVNDLLHGWLNYQIEHHTAPDLSMLSYVKMAPLMRSVCKKHGVPYIQESVWIRLAKTLRVSVGTDNMRQW